MRFRAHLPRWLRHHKPPPVSEHPLPPSEETFEPLLGSEFAEFARMEFKDIAEVLDLASMAIEASDLASTTVASNKVSENIWTMRMVAGKIAAIGSRAAQLSREANYCAHVADKSEERKARKAKRPYTSRPLNSFPVEIVVHIILQCPDADTLKAFCAASPTVWRLWKRYNLKMFIVKRELLQRVESLLREPTAQDLEDMQRCHVGSASDLRLNETLTNHYRNLLSRTPLQRIETLSIINLINQLNGPVLDFVEEGLMGATRPGFARRYIWFHSEDQKRELFVWCRKQSPLHFIEGL